MSIVVFREDSEERIKELAIEMGWDDVRIADGCMKRLWQTSQALSVAVTSASKIIAWCLEKHAPERLIKSLLEAKFITQIGPDAFEIRGNKSEIRKIKRSRKQKSDAAKSKWKKHKKTGPTTRQQKESGACGPEGKSDAVRNALDSCIDAGSSAGSGLDAGTTAGSGVISSGAEMPTAVSPPADMTLVPAKRRGRPRKPPTDGSLVWAAYREAYHAKYGHEPVRNGKNNKHCSQLVERLGAEAAIEVVRFYLTHSDGYYVRRSHPLDSCLQNAEGLHTEMRRGQRITATEAAAIDRQQSNAEAFAAVARALEAEGLLK